MSDEDDLSGEINPIVSSQQQSVASRLTSFFGKRNNRQHQQLNIAELNSNKSNEDTASVTSFTEMKKRSSILSGTNPAFQLKGLFSPKNKSSSSRSKKSQGSGIEIKDGIDYWTDYYLENEVGEDDDAADPCDFENDLRNDEMTRIRTGRPNRPEQVWFWVFEESFSNEFLLPWLEKRQLRGLLQTAGDETVDWSQWRRRQKGNCVEFHRFQTYRRNGRPL
jgi:hypothetical protein